VLLPQALGVPETLPVLRLIDLTIQVVLALILEFMLYG
jgi:hypothetical protein